MYTQTEKVNIEPKSYLPVFRISQNDVGRTLKAHLVSDEGTITIPTSATVTMAGIKPSGLGYTVTGTFDGSDVTFETDATMTDEAGQIESEIRIVDGETLIGTTNVILNVEPNPHPSDTTDGQREPLVNEITALLNQITAQADRVEEYSSKVLNMTVSAHESQEPTVTKTEGEVVNLDFGLPRGEKGERGERGEQGEAGKDGKDGLDGKDGKDGKDGINGVTPDFSIGTVTTLEPNESASVTLTGTEEEPVLNFGIPRGEKGEQGDVSLSDLEKIMVTDMASGAIASFPDGSDLLPAKSLIANIIPKQSGSGTPSPDNVRPISGWESVEATRSGKNLLENASDSYSISGATYHAYTVKNLSSYSGKKMTFSIVTSDIKGKRIALYKNGDLIKVGSFGTKFMTATMPAFTDSDVLRLYLQDYTADSVAITGAQLELGSTATAYEPYQADTYTTDLPETVYGGSLDVVTGVLTVTHALVDLGSLDWVRTNDSRIDVGYSFRTGSLTNRKFSRDFILDRFMTSEVDTLTAIIARYGASVNNIAFQASGGFDLYIIDSRYSDAASFKAAMNGAKLVYPLATPQTYQLTPQTINTLAGVNNVWVDSGDCSITYYADTKLYIDKKLGGN